MDSACPRADALRPLRQKFFIENAGMPVYEKAFAGGDRCDALRKAFRENAVMQVYKII